jgi:hypothetical protein
MLTPVLLLALAAAPFSIALPGLNSVKLAPGEAEMYAEMLSQRLIARGLKVMSARDLGSVLGLERQKEIAGCSEGNCTAELAAGLGVEALLVGDVGKPGSEYFISLKLLSAKDGSVIAFHTGSAANPDVLKGEIDRAAWMLVKQVAALPKWSALQPGPEPLAGVSESASAFSRVQKWSLAPAVIGIAGIGAGIVLFTAAPGNLQRLNGASTLADAARERDAGNTNQTLGVAGLAIGSAALVGAVAMFVFGGSSAVEPTAIVTPQGASFGVAGMLP